MSIDENFGSVTGASILELRPSGRGRPRSEKDLGTMEGGSRIEGLRDRGMTSGRSDWRRMTSEKLDVVEDDLGKVGCGRGSGIDSESLWISRWKVLGRWDMCHYSDEGQILTTTDAPAFLLVEVWGREVGEAKILGVNALKLIMTFVP